MTACTCIKKPLTNHDCSHLWWQICWTVGTAKKKKASTVGRINKLSLIPDLSAPRENDDLSVLVAPMLKGSTRRGGLRLPSSLALGRGGGKASVGGWQWHGRRATQPWPTAGGGRHNQIARGGWRRAASHRPTWNGGAASSDLRYKGEWGLHGSTVVPRLLTCKHETVLITRLSRCLVYMD